MPYIVDILKFKTVLTLLPIIKCMLTLVLYKLRHRIQLIRKWTQIAIVYNWNLLTGQKEKYLWYLQLDLIISIFKMEQRICPSNIYMDLIIINSKTQNLKMTYTSQRQKLKYGVSMKKSSTFMVYLCNQSNTHH